ncbi:MAG TPA: hypothetical protein VK778_16835 [Solirubrobacteraceae bacterium]|jgi:hypothetical protein|nr:hypothetical protein [Solirubrobacteraceae bacterium]
MGRRKQRNIKIREDRLSKLDGTKMEVAIWLLAKGTVEDRTRRSQPAPPKADAVNEPLGGDVDAGELPGAPGPRT